MSNHLGFTYEPLPALPEESLQARFEAFHAANPQVFAELRRLALEWRAVHGAKAKVGIARLVEVFRWNHAMKTRGDAFKINNDYRSRYARLLMQESGLDGVFNTRELHS